MKPVAWIASDGKSFSYTEPPSKNYLGMTWWKPVHLACPTDQLREAQAEVLREAAQQALKLGGYIAQLNLLHMADGLEKQT